MIKTIVTSALCLFLAGAAVGQETTSVAGARAFLDDVRDWPPDYDVMTRDLAKRTRKVKGNLRKLFSRAGEVENVVFWQTYRGLDLYLVSFANARAVMLFARDEDGKVSMARLRPVAP